MSHINLKGFGNVEISKGTMGRNNYGTRSSGSQGTAE